MLEPRSKFLPSDKGWEKFSPEFVAHLLLEIDFQKTEIECVSTIWRALDGGKSFRRWNEQALRNSRAFKKTPARKHIFSKQRAP